MVAKRSEMSGPARPDSEPQSSDDERRRLMQELAGLMLAANKKPAKPADLRALKEFFDKHPDIIGSMPALADGVTCSLIEKLAQREGRKELFRRELTHLCERLDYADAPGLERLMIERIALCWLRLQYVEAMATQIINSGQSMKQCEYVDKLLTRAHKRFESACVSLAKIRKLGLGKKAGQPSALALLKPTA